MTSRGHCCWLQGVYQSSQALQRAQSLLDRCRGRLETFTVHFEVRGHTMNNGPVLAALRVRDGCKAQWSDVKLCLR